MAIVAIELFLGGNAGLTENPESGPTTCVVAPQVAWCYISLKNVFQPDFDPVLSQKQVTCQRFWDMWVVKTAPTGLKTGQKYFPAPRWPKGIVGKNTIWARL